MPAQLRILMLHGFAQSGPSFQVKTRKLTYLIEQVLSSSVLSKYPDGIKFLYPTGSLNLVPADQTGEESRERESDNWAWWRTLDTTSQYRELDSTFQMLSDYISLNGQVDGVIGFSQGASLAAMFSSWCESGGIPGRAPALASQVAPLTFPAPQGPLKFAICFAGFKASEKFYPGFYEPKIETPVMHVRGELDNMVHEHHTMDLLRTCVNGSLLVHDGGHYVPLHSNILLTAAAFVKSKVKEGSGELLSNASIKEKTLVTISEMTNTNSKKRRCRRHVVLCTRHIRVIRLGSC